MVEAAGGIGEDVIHSLLARFGRAQSYLTCK